MSGSNNGVGLVERSVFDRVASSLNGWIRQGSVEFRFVRGGTFRASVVKERLPATLTSIQVDNALFDVALSEVVVFLNAYVFDSSLSSLAAQLKAQTSQFNFPSKSEDEFQREVEKRLDYIKTNVSVETLKSRAYLRLYATSLTFDSLSWSLTKGRLYDSDDKSVDVTSVAILLSFFRPGFAQPRSSPFSFNILDLGIPQTEKIAVNLDEVDITDLISELEKMKQALQLRARK